MLDELDSKRQMTTIQAESRGLDGADHMTTDQHKKHREMAVRGKYQRLYAHLCELKSTGVEDHLWRNRGHTRLLAAKCCTGLSGPGGQIREDFSGRAQALAWTAAGWKTSKVDMHAETLVFKRVNEAEPRRRPTIDEILPARSVGGWPEGLTLSREDIYEDGI